MKNKVIIMVVLLLTIITMVYSADYTISYTSVNRSVSQLHYEGAGYAIIEKIIAGKTYSVLSFEGGVNLTKKGYAELPVINTALALSAQNDLTYTITKANYTDITLKYPILPARGIIYRNENPDQIPYAIAEESQVDNVYPERIVELGTPYIIKDIRGVNVLIYPFQYNAQKQTLRVYNTITIQLTEDTTRSTNPIANTRSNINPLMNQVYASIFTNYEPTRELAIGEMGDILVIYTARDKDAIQPYIQWKREKGFQVYEEQVSTGTNVKTLIQNRYNANNDILYVQLVGDWADIKSDAVSGAPRDPLLGCVAGNDDHPDIIIGRFSVNSAAELTDQVNKTIKYEREPDLQGTWYHQALGIGGTDGPSDDEASDWEQVDNIKLNKLLPSTYTEVFEAYKNPSTSSVVDIIDNKGVSLINYSNHGTTDNLPIGNVSNAVADNLLNTDKPFMITSVACLPGEFNNDCLAEHLMKNPRGGAINAWMATINQPWYPPYYGQDYFNDLLIGGYNYDTQPGSGINTYEGRTTFGSLTFNAGLLMYTEDTSSQSKDTLTSWIVFGDASLQVRTDKPAPITLSNIEVQSGIPYTTTVTANGGVSGALVSLYQDGNTYSSVTDAGGMVTIEHQLVDGPAKLVVTGYNLATIYQDITVGPSGPTPTPSATPTATPIYTNVALYKPVTASGRFSADFPEAAVNDGYKNTTWGSLHNQGSQWIFVDLQQQTDVDTVVIRFFNPYFSPYYHVGISDDAKTWEFAKTITNGNGGDDIIPINRTTRYIGVLLTQGAKKVYGIREFEVYTKTMPPTPTPTPTALKTPTPTPTATPTSTPSNDTWQVGVYYPKNAEVLYNGRRWRCLVGHTSNSAWYPGAPGVYIWVEVYPPGT